MRLAPEDISISVTVHRRLEYLETALASAVHQTVPVRVRLHDDSGEESAGVQKILSRFSGRVEHVREGQNRGLFGNMNACLRSAITPWISILHDDDALAPDFVERILEAAGQVDDAALFFGGTVYLHPDGSPFHRSELDPHLRCRPLEAAAFALRTWFAFPGQLIHAPTAVRVGGFPLGSLYTGDWDLWFRLAQAGGAVQVGAYTGLHRMHLGAERGTTAVAKTGRKLPCCAMQAKRNLARLRRDGQTASFNRRDWVAAQRPHYRDLVVYADRMPGWLLQYNRRILLYTHPQGRGSRILHQASRLFGTPALRLASRIRRFAARSGARVPPPF